MRRKLVIAGLVFLVLVVVGAGVLWLLKPWVPEIELTDTGATGRRIVEEGLFANYFPADRVDRGPAVMIIGGSEGGIGDNSTRAAIQLQARGFSVLTPSYFGAPGQPGQLELIPLETFDRALSWLRSRPEVDPERVGVVGVSKGAEAALVVGTRDKQLKAVVASAPTSAVWPGIDWSSFDPDSSWTSDGRPLAVLPYGGLPFGFGDVGRVYREGLKNLPKHPDAVIEVERINGGVLLACGELDNLWPSCPMARQVRERAQREGRPDVRVLAYPQAGHRVFGPPLDDDDPDFVRLGRWGGTPAANNNARKDAWPKVMSFLRAELGD